MLEQRISKGKLSKNYVLDIYTYIHTTIHVQICTHTHTQSRNNFSLKITDGMKEIQSLNKQI